MTKLSFAKRVFLWSLIPLAQACQPMEQSFYEREGHNAATTDDTVVLGDPPLDLPLTADERSQTASALLAAEPNEWTFVPVPHATCANGGATGVGINPGPASSNFLIIFYQGGGACSEALSCYALNTATYVSTGYNESTFRIEENLFPSFLLLHRDGSETLNNAHLAYIPYCTGDVHGGNNVISYPGAPRPTFHQGGLKAQLSTEVLAAAFPNVRRVLIVGDSAGGLGVVLNYGQTQARFSRARVDVLADSGEDSGFVLGSPSWGIIPPLNCSGCDLGNFSSLLPGYARMWPKNRFAAMSFATDAVLPTFNFQSPQQFSALVQTYFNEINKNENAHTLTAPGTGHVVLASPGVKVGDSSVKGFVDAMVSDSNTWKTLP